MPQQAMAIRHDISIPANGTHIAAWHYRAAAPGAGCVLLAHGFALTREAGLCRYAEKFAAAGFDAIVFDYRHFGASGGTPRELLDVRRQLEDWRTVIRFVRSAPGLRGDRLALWGTSFSGGHVLKIAAGDPAVAAAIAQVPFVDGMRMPGVLGLRCVARQGLAAWRDLARAAMRRGPLYVPVVGPPGELVALPVAGARAGYRCLAGPERADAIRVAARCFLTLPLYRPVQVAGKVRCPLLLQVAQADSLTPAAGARRVAELAPRAQLETFAGDHFDIYRGEAFEKTTCSQVRFLEQHLGGAA